MDRLTKTVYVARNRHNIIRFNVGFDVSQDSFASEIRSDPSPAGSLLATWACTFETDGSDGILLLTLTKEQANAIDVDRGYMDVKRVSGGLPLQLFSGYLTVLIRDTVTS